jgi:hypothetical protein
MRSADLADSPAVCHWGRIARRCFLRAQISSRNAIRNSSSTPRSGCSAFITVGFNAPNYVMRARFRRAELLRIIPGVCFSIELGIYLEGKFGVRSEINVYVLDKDIEVTGQPIQTEIIPILKIH